MSKPNFKTMEMKELRRYVLDHRDDQEAWDEYASRSRPNAVTIPANAPPEVFEQMLKEAIDKKQI